MSGTFTGKDDLVRIRISTLVAIFTLTLGGMLVSADPAAADAARPYQDESCDVWIQPGTGDVYRDCMETKGVYQITRSAAGVVKVSDNGEYTVEHSINWNVYSSRTGSWHVTQTYKDGEQKVVHVLSGETYTMGDVTCTDSRSWTITDDKIRHEIHIDECGLD